jgi:hypothetical protein
MDCPLTKNSILLPKDGTRRVDKNTLVALTLMVAARSLSDIGTKADFKHSSPFEKGG